MIRKSIAGVLALVLTVVLMFGTAVRADATQGCILDVLGIKVCGTLLTPLPTVRVTLPPVLVTVNVPGPTRTVTLPGLPGATKTVLVTVPGQTVTRTSQPQAGPTVGPGTSSESTVTKTVTVSSSGHRDHTRGTIIHSKPSPLFNVTGHARTAAGIGLLSLLALIGIILAGMAYAFRVGRRSKDNEDVAFMRALLDSVKSRGAHR